MGEDGTGRDATGLDWTIAASLKFASEFVWRCWQCAASNPVQYTGPDLTSVVVVGNRPPAGPFVITQNEKMYKVKLSL
jgi:hypothetical protein